jgi:hypothetical protein
LSLFAFGVEHVAKAAAMDEEEGTVSAGFLDQWAIQDLNL